MQIRWQTGGAHVASACTCSGRKYCRYSTPPGAAVMDRSEDRCEVDDLSQQLLFNPVPVSKSATAEICSVVEYTFCPGAKEIRNVLWH